MSSQAVVAKIAQPYAEALLEIAKNSGNLSDISQEMKLIAETLSKSQELQNFLANPLSPAKAKKELLIKLFSEETSAHVLNFLLILTDKKRIGILDSIAARYLELAYQASNITLAKVVSSVALTDEQKAALTAKIKSITSAAQVELIIQMDKELIGGFTIQVGSQVIDKSLQGQIKQMAAHLDINV